MGHGIIVFDAKSLPGERDSPRDTSTVSQNVILSN